MRPSPFVPREDFEALKAQAKEACAKLTEAGQELIDAAREIERLRAELHALKAERPAWFSPTAEA
jgi:chromosome segregation ATPase